MSAVFLGCCALTACADVASPVLTFDAPPYFSTVVFMPGGQQVLLGDGAGSEIVLWDLQTGQQNRVFEGGVLPVAVSLDGRWGLTASGTNAGKLWNLQTMELIRTFVGHTNTLTAVAFSPDGQRVVTGSTDGTARIWDAQSGAVLRTLPLTNTVVSAVFSPDGRCVLTGQQPDETHPGGEPRLWDAPTGQLLRVFEGGGGAATFALGGRSILAPRAGAWRQSGLWDVVSGQVVWLNNWAGFIVSPDGRLSLTTGFPKGGAPCIVDLANDVVVRNLGYWNFGCVALSPDGRRVIVGPTGEHTTTTLWDIGDLVDWLGQQWHRSDVVNRPLQTFGFGSARDLALYPDGKRFVTAGSRGVLVRDLESGEVKASFEHTNEIMSIAVSLDGGMLAIGSGDGAFGGDNLVRLLDAETLQVKKVLSGHSWRVGAVAFSPTGGLVLTGSADNTARLWEVETGQLLRTLSGHSNEVRSVALSRDGRQLLTGSSDDTARLWDAETGQQERVFRAPGQFPDVWSVAFSPDETEVVAGTTDTVHTWTLATGQLLRSLQTGGGWTPSISFSPDGNSLLTGHDDGAARLWDATTSQLRQVFHGATNGLNCVWSAVFTPDGSRVVAGCWDGDIRIWNTLTGQLLHLFPNSLDRPPYMLSGDGENLLTQGASGSGRLWEIWENELIRTFPQYVDALLTDQFLGLFASTNSPDRRRELHMGYDYFQIVETGTGTVLRMSYADSPESYPPSFSPDGRFVATPGYTPRLYDAEAAQVLRTFAGNHDFVESVAFSPDGLLLFTTDMWDTTQVWDLRDLVVGLRVSRGAQGPEVRWEKGRLQAAQTVNGPWQEVTNAVSPLQVDLVAGTRFYRVRVEK